MRMTSRAPAEPQPGDGESSRGRAARRVVAWLGWWVVLMTFWVIIDGSAARDELLAGAAAAALGALLAELASHQASMRFRIRPRWLARAAVLPGEVLADTGIVFAALWRRLVRGEEPRSGFVADPMSYGADTPEGRMRRALLIGVESVAPNKFALGIDAGRDVMLAHKLVLDEGERAQ